MAEHATFCWNELMTDNVERAKAFYTETLGWTYDAMPMPEGTYYVIKHGEKMVGGMMDMTGIVPEGVPPHWFSYIEVDDVDARAAKVADAGGNIKRDPFDIPNVGRIAIVEDATGAVIGWIKSENP